MKILAKDGNIDIYDFNGEYVVIGAYQDPEKEVRLDYIDKNNIGLIKSKLFGASVYVGEDTVVIRLEGSKEFL